MSIMRDAEANSDVARSVGAAKRGSAAAKRGTDPLTKPAQTILTPYETAAAPLAPDVLASVLDCERRILNAWPSPTTLLIGDWAVRMANGYSGRANSATAIAADAELNGETLELIEGMYRAEGLPPCIRLTPLVADGTRARIQERGYRLKDASFGMVATLAAGAADDMPGLHLAPMATPAWINGVCALQPENKSNATHLAGIVGNVRLPAAFASVTSGRQTIGYGMSVAERGMAEIGSLIIHPGHRGRGIGRALVRGLMGWAAGQGCTRAFLQVEQGNGGAIALYESLGFRTIYTYETLILGA